MPYKLFGELFDPVVHRQQKQQEEINKMKIQEAQKQQMQGPSNHLADIMNDKNFSVDDAVKLKTFGTPEQQEMGQAWLDNRLGYDKRTIENKYGVLDPITLDFYRDKVMADPNYITKFSARSPQRAQISNAVAEESKRLGVKIPEMVRQNLNLVATERSYKQQKKAFDATVKTSNEFLNDADRVLDMVAKVRTQYPAWANKSLVQLKKISAAPGLGDEAVVLNELFALSDAFMRTATDTSETISELSQGLRETMDKLNDPYSPLNVVEKRIRNQQKQVREKVGSRKKSLMDLGLEVEKYANFNKKKELNDMKKERRKQFNEFKKNKLKNNQPNQSLNIGRFKVEVE